MTGTFSRYLIRRVLDPILGDVAFRLTVEIAWVWFHSFLVLWTNVTLKKCYLLSADVRILILLQGQIITWNFKRNKVSDSCNLELNWKLTLKFQNGLLGENCTVDKKIFAAKVTH